MRQDTNRNQQWGGKMRSRNRKTKQSRTHTQTWQQGHGDLYSGFLYNYFQLKYSNKYQIKKKMGWLYNCQIKHTSQFFSSNLLCTNELVTAHRSLSSGFDLICTLPWIVMREIQYIQLAHGILSVVGLRLVHSFGYRYSFGIFTVW